MLVFIQPTGAEIKSIFLKNLQLELIWPGDQKVWARSAPWLFPIVGKLKDNTYKYKDKTFQLPQHGFARDSHFQVEESSPAMASFTLASNSETLKNYPFDFHLRVTYQLENDGIEIRIEIENPSESIRLPCSFGMHPGFRAHGPMQIIFQSPEGSFVGLNNAGLLIDEVRAELDTMNRLTVSPALFDLGALILTQLNSSTIKFRNGPLQIELNLSNWSSFGIWSPPTGGKDLQFICLEPWNGYNDPQSHDTDFAHKPGVCWVEPGQSFKSSLTVRVKEDLK